MSGPRPHFVPASHSGSRKDTAVLLVGTAREFGIDQHDIQSTPTGYLISDALHDVLYDESTPTKTSGRRTAKNDSQKGK